MEPFLLEQKNSPCDLCKVECVCDEYFPGLIAPGRPAVWEPMMGWPVAGQVNGMVNMAKIGQDQPAKKMTDHYHF